MQIIKLDNRAYRISLLFYLLLTRVVSAVQFTRASPTFDFSGYMELVPDLRLREFLENFVLNLNSLNKKSRFNKLTCKGKCSHVHP